VSTSAEHAGAPREVAEGAAPKRRPVNRRTVLGAALAGGAGVAAIRLWGGSLEALHAGSVRFAGGRPDWVSPLSAEAARVSHLLRRTTFGATPEQLDQALADGFDKTVDRLLETPPQPPPAFAAGSGGRFSIAQLQVWWLDHILTTKTPFAERMTFFWHGHFTSDFQKVGLQSPFLYWQNLTWRQMALTDLRSMLMKVTTDPAMLRYLDLGTSTGDNPNENYSRELMELFTMGPGNYTEDDVRAAAKALAGWTFPRPPYSSPVAGVFNPRRAYQGGPLTYLRKTGRFDTQAVLDQILAQPATAPFIVTKVLQHFVLPQPPADYVKRLADSFRKSKYDLKTLLRGVFASPEFSSQQAYRALVKSPIEYMVSGARALGTPDATSRLIVQMAPNLGQILFDPPDVGGWPNNEAWISSNTVIARVNFATALLGSLRDAIPSAAHAHSTQLEGVLSPQTAAALNQASDDRTRWFLVLASPEFQLK
jgi:uncharacterized protein (DUF1800 family)